MEWNNHHIWVTISDGKYRFFLYRYISTLWPKKSIISICIDIFPRNKKSRHCRQFFLVFGSRRCRVNSPAPPPLLIFTLAVFSISGTEVQRSDIWTNDVRCGNGDMWAMSAVSKMGWWWGGGATGLCGDPQI